MVDRTRVAAWTAASATTIGGVAVLYSSWRLAQADHFREALASVLLTLPFPVGITIALLRPERAITRAAFVLGAALPTYSSIQFFLLFWPREENEFLDVFLRGYVNGALIVALFLAALAWTIRPTRIPTYAARALAAGLFVFPFTTPDAFAAGVAPFLTVRAALGLALLVPFLAVAIGLPRLDRAPTSL